jgi:hypothetical protein
MAYEEVPCSDPVKENAVTDPDMLRDPVTMG